MFKHGRFTKQAKQVSKFFRQMAKDGEAMVAKTLNAHGLRRKIPARIRRRVHVRKALAAAKAKAKEGTK